MKRFKIKSTMKSILCMGLAFLITVTSLLTSGAVKDNTIVVDASSAAKARVETYIGLAAGKSGTSLANIGQLTQDELQFLGVYLSNYYVPFSTELGIAGETEAFETQKAKMVDALAANMSFNEIVCEELVENIIGLSRTNYKTLKVRFMNGFNGNKQDVAPYGVMDVNYYDFINMMLGTFGSYGFKGTSQENFVSEGGFWNDLAAGLANMVSVVNPTESINASWGIYTHKSKYIGAILDTRVQYAEFGYEDDSGNFIPVLDAAIKPSYTSVDSIRLGTYGGDNDHHFTASQIAFFQCLGFVNADKYGFDFFDISGEDIGNPDASADDIISALQQKVSDGTLKVEDLLDMSAYGNEVLVDCFGNIIRGGTNHQTVVIPGCMNPFTWMPVYEDGEDDEESYGEIYQSITIPAMSLDNAGLLYDASTLEKSSYDPDHRVNAMFATKGTLENATRKTDTVETVNLNSMDDLQTKSFKTVVDYKYFILTGEYVYFDPTSQIAYGTSNTDAVSRFEKLVEAGLNLLKWVIPGGDDGGSDVEVELPGIYYWCGNDGCEGCMPKDLSDIGEFVDGKACVLGDPKNYPKGYNIKVLEMYHLGADAPGGLSENTLFRGYDWLMDSVDEIISMAPAATNEYTHIKGWNIFRGIEDRNVVNSFFDGLTGNDDESNMGLMKSLQTLAGDGGSWGSWGVVYGNDNEDIFSWANSAESVIGGSTHPYLVTQNILEADTTEAFTTICVIDSLGAFGFDTSNSAIAYDAIQFIPYYGFNGEENLNFIDSYSSSFAFGSGLEKLNRNEVVPKAEIETISPESSVALYTTYAIAGLYIDGTEDENVAKLGYRICRENLPQIANDPLLFSESYADSLLKDEIMNMLYYLLKPDAVEYVKAMIKNKLQAIMVDWHNDMVGTQGTGVTTGSTYYRTNYGYVTTPDLSEVQWTASLLDFYDSMIPILVIFMIISMLLAFVTGTMSLQRAALGVIVFSAFLLVPTNAINWVVGTSNNITNRLYGDKFVYWAVVQQETYSGAIDTAATGDSYENYIKTVYSQAAANQGGESIVLRWQAPKKMASLMLSSGDKNLLDTLQGNLLNRTLLNNTLSGEEYLDGASQYLYRDFSDISNFSRYIYHSLKEGTRSGVGPTNYTNTWTNINGVDPRDAFKDYVNAGYTNGSNSWLGSVVLSEYGSKVYMDATDCEDNASHTSILTKIKNGQIGQNDYVGINQELFNVSLAYFNNKKQGTGEYDETTGEEIVEDLTFESAILNNATETNKDDLQIELDKYGENQFNGLMVYGVLSESPYYYFSWNLYDMGMNSGANARGGYRNMLLSGDSGEFFYNMDGNGELKDFTNIRNMFVHVMPYLKRGNDIVRAWDDRYGIFIYDGVPTEEGYLDDYNIQNDDELKHKYWHNLNVARLYTIYTPWLDLMYDCSYAEPQYVSVMGEKIWVEDPLDPRSYPNSRPMIFSESEMYDYGLTEADLTEVERKILEFNRRAEEVMFELLNYYNFSDAALNSAAAIMLTFEFNNIFSETGLFSDNINLYPQNFEVKDFSYDAFLRFILSTSTGESISGSNDFYGDLVKKSSTTTAIMLLVCDVLSQYAMPFAKIVFLIAIFISSILLILVTVFKVDPEFRFVGKLMKGIFIPLLSFFVVTVGFAYVISLFMGTANNAVTQTAEVTISLGDPNMVLIAMCVIDLVCLVLYIKLLMGVWNDIKTNFKLVKDHVGGLVGGTIALGGALAISTANAVRNGGSGSGASGGYIAENGTGQESARASSRSAKKQSEVLERGDAPRNETNRMSESRRRTMNQAEGASDEKRSEAINQTIQSGRRNVNKDNAPKEKPKRRGGGTPSRGMGYNSDGTPFGKGVPEKKD